MLLRETQDQKIRKMEFDNETSKHKKSSKRLLWEGSTGGGHGGERSQNCSATWLPVVGFMVMGLVSRLSLANHSDSGSFLAASAWLRQEGFQRGGFWEVGRTYRLASPPSFWPFLNSSSGWQLVSSLFLTRTSCCRITHAYGYCDTWPWQMVSVSDSSNMSEGVRCIEFGMEGLNQNLLPTKDRLMCLRVC